MKNMNITRKLIVFFSLGLVVVLSGCFRSLQADPILSDVPAFVPPTLTIPTPTLIPTLSANQMATQTSVAQCKDSLTFIKDETVPDGTTVQPGASIDKRWEVQNSGTCNWGKGYTIKLVGGTDMGVTSPLNLFPARSNTTTSIQIEFLSPKESGSYRSAWQAYNPDGEAFGDIFYIDIVVAN